MGAGWDRSVRPRDPAQVEATARAILAGRQFRPPPRSIPQAVWHWISKEWHSLFPSLPTGGIDLPRWLGLLLVVVAVAVAVVLVVRGGGLRRRLRHRAGHPVTVHTTADDLGVGADTWRERALAAEAAGDWREGVRCRYRSVLATLAAAGVVAEAVGRTAGEYRRRVAADLPAARSAFAAATTVFEETWYGSAVAGPGSRDRLEEAATGVGEALNGDGRRMRAGAGAGAGGWDG